MSRILLLLTLGFISFVGIAEAQSLQLQTYQAAIPLYDGSNDLGEVQVEINGDQLNWIDKKTLLQILKNYVKPDTLSAVEKLPSEINPSSLPFPLKLDQENFRLQTQFNLKELTAKSTDLGIDLSEQEHVAMQPAPVGGAINFRGEKTWSDEKLGGNYLSGQFSPFVNIGGVVLENQTFYQENIDSKWYRGDTRLVKDILKYDVRTQVGDVYPLIQGFMVARPLGGINIQRNFSLNPYRLPYPTGHQTFTLGSRSFVKYYVNSVLVKSEYLMAGNYNAKDIPLNNGLNTVTIEATDDLGQKKIFVFKSSSNINLLNEGESRFDLSYGTPFTDFNFKREYQERDGKVFSGFYQYGFSSLFSSSVYLQNQDKFNLYGTELIQAIPLGNFTFGYARSDSEALQGSAGSLGYQLITQGKKWYDSHTLSLRYESRTTGFRSTLLDAAAAVQNAYAANYTIPVSNVMTFSVGGNYGDVRNNNLENRYGYDLNLSFRLFQKHNISFYSSRNRDEFKQWNETAYVFLTFSIPDSNSYVSAFYDQQQKNTRINVLKDNQNRLYNFRTQGIVDYAEKSQNGELDLLYPTPVGDFGGRFAANRDDANDNEFLKRGSLRVNSALAFAYQDKELGLGFSRPISGSFVLFKPEPRLKDQRIGLKSTSPYTESESGLFDEIIFSNLIAYQYRDIQLDPTFLDDGRSLEREKFVLYPTFRSAHLVKLQEKGAVIITGRIVDKNGAPISLQTGHVNNVVFFTNRDGEIFVEGVEAGKHQLTLDGQDEKFYIEISKGERGMKNIGEIQFSGDDQ